MTNGVGSGGNRTDEEHKAHRDHKRRQKARAPCPVQLSTSYLQARAKEGSRNELKRIVSDTLQQLAGQQQGEQVFVYTPGLCGNHTEQRYDWSLMPEVHTQQAAPG